MSNTATSAKDWRPEPIEMLSQPPAGDSTNGNLWGKGATTVTSQLKRGDRGGRGDSDDDDALEANQAESDVFFKSSPDDAHDMRRMGHSQQFVRHFRLLSVMSFVAMATSSWELCVFSITPGLIDGGRPVILYSMLWSFVGFTPVYLSMAEMASIAPIAGAQYHWVSEFAPDHLQKVLSYLTGWTSTLAWQAANVEGCVLVGTLIQGVIAVNNPDYAAPRWHGTLLTMGAIAIALLANVYGNRALPHWQNAAFALHCMVYLAVVIPIWINAPKAPVSDVFTDFKDSGGWGNLPLAIMIGQTSGINPLTGVDSAAHMSEEVHDASRSVPRAMMSIFLVNFFMTFFVFFTILYHIPSVAESLEDPSTYPLVYVLRNSMSIGWMTALLSVIIAVLMCHNITYLTATSRDIFAFARDRGVPRSKWLSKINRKTSVPTNACLFTCLVSSCLALIYIGSDVAFYAMTSLFLVALLQCYCLSIGCMLWRRIFKPETLPSARYSLGKWGIPINAMAVIYSFWCFFWAFWPQQQPVTATGFNWSSVLFIATLLVSLIYFVFVARKTYAGPVALVEGRKKTQ